MHNKVSENATTCSIIIIISERKIHYIIVIQQHICADAIPYWIYQRLLNWKLWKWFMRYFTLFFRLSKIQKSAQIFREINVAWYMWFDFINVLNPLWIKTGSSILLGRSPLLAFRINRVWFPCLIANLKTNVQQNWW